jgi:sporulation protein YlmC with PRC-barrel domain
MEKAEQFVRPAVDWMNAPMTQQTRAEPPSKAMAAPSNPFGIASAIGQTAKGSHSMEQTTTSSPSTASGSDRRPLERDETTSLISSSKVDGTSVYDKDGEKIGNISHLMIGKRSGRVEYAVMNFGSFLGMGGSYHPLPWDVLNYDSDLGGYRVPMDKEKLRGAPSFREDQQPAFDRHFGQTVYGYYGVAY